MMKSWNKKLGTILMIGMITLSVAFTAQAKKKKEKEPYQGPVVEVCKTKKNGTEVCKDQKLKDQKAANYIYQQLLMLGEISAANTAVVLGNQQIIMMQSDILSLQNSAPNTPPTSPALKPTSSALTPLCWNWKTQEGVTPQNWNKPLRTWSNAYSLSKRV